MNIFSGSWIPKVFGVLGSIAAIAAIAMPQYGALIGAIGALIASAGHLFVRQDNKSSEQVGAGNVPPTANGLFNK